MKRKIATVLAVLTSVVLWADNSDVFKITAKDEGMLSKEFIAKLRAGVGDKNAARASWELHQFAWRLIRNAKNAVEMEDLKVEYLNYLERLYKKALNAALKKMSPRQRAAVLKREKAWNDSVVESYDFEIKDKKGEHIFTLVDNRFRDMRLYLNRARYWECSPARRAEIDRFHGLKVRSVRGELPVQFNELRRTTPIRLLALPADFRNKTYIEDLASLPVEFCREVKIGRDIYQLAILIPNNDISFERSTQGEERVLTVWKNREFYACYYLPLQSDIRSVQIRGTQVSVTYTQVDNLENRKRSKPQTFTIDFTYYIFAPVKITNWLDYHMDGLGNLHTDECCKGKF